MRVAVTGASGNVGTSVIAALIQTPFYSRHNAAAERILDRIEASEVRRQPTRRWRCGADALLELLGGIRDGAGADTPPLDQRAGGPLRIRELLTGVGARTP